MALKLTNNATSTLATTITAGATSLSVQSADAGLFPVLGAGDWFPITVVDASNNMEVMKVTARATAVLTVERAQEGTTALAFTAGARIDLRVTAAALGALENANAITGATAKTPPVDADEFGYRNSSGGGFVKSTWAQINAAIWTGLGALIIGGTSKATPADADGLALADSADANNTKKLTWANAKAAIWAALGALIAGGTSKTTPVDADTFPMSDSAAANASKKLTWANLKAALTASAIGGHEVCQGRLTLTSGTPITTADVTAATALYFTPFRGNQIGLYDGTRWVTRTFAELTLSIAGYQISRPFDIFAYDNAGTVALESAMWSTDTVRATALALQDGVYVKSGAPTRRYLGTIYTSATGQTEDSYYLRYVWNYYNRVCRPMRKTDATDSWNYTTATVRAANGNAANRIEFVIGVSEDMVSAEVKATASNPTASTTMLANIGLDSFTAFASGAISNSGNSAGNYITPLGGAWQGFPGVGRHYATWLEYSQATGTTTFYGDGGFPSLFQCGIFGEVYG